MWLGVLLCMCKLRVAVRLDVHQLNEFLMYFSCYASHHVYMVVSTGHTQKPTRKPNLVSVIVKIHLVFSSVRKIASLFHIL